MRARLLLLMALLLGCQLVEGQLAERAEVGEFEKKMQGRRSENNGTSDEGEDIIGGFNNEVGPGILSLTVRAKRRGGRRRYLPRKPRWGWSRCS
jgi:hypothetical protein